jgi:hypothetical protein
MARTIIIKDNKTGFRYKTKIENILDQPVSVLPNLFNRLSILLGDNPAKKIVDIFDIDLEYSTAPMFTYSRIPEFSWVSVLLEDNDLGGIARGISPYKALGEICKKCVRNCCSRIVYVTRSGNISSKPLYGSVIEYKDSIIGIYRIGYTPEGNVGATLKTDKKEIGKLMDFYKSKCKK